MATKERILLVENDPDISDIVARQALEPLGFNIQVVSDANNAIQQAIQFSPDLIISDVNLPGLSGKDLLVALNAQGLKMPMIVIAQRGDENTVIQSFRLGATDYLLWPVREAEIVSAVERALKQVREVRERRLLDSQLKETNEQLQQRVRELTTIFGIAKAVVSITDQRIRLDKIVEGMLYVAEAEYGYLLVRDEKSKTFLMSAHCNLPEAWANKVGQPFDDGIGSLVALSGETLTIEGEPLKRFKVSSLGQSAMVVPVKIQKEVIGLLVIIRKEKRTFDHNMQVLLEAVADYASISLLHTRLFRALHETADAAQESDKRKYELLQSLRQAVMDNLQPVVYPIGLMLAGKMGPLTDEQQKALQSIQAAIQHALHIISKKPAVFPSNSAKK